MLAYGLFRATCVWLCLLLVCVGGGKTLAQSEISCNTLPLPQNTAPFLPGSSTLLNLLDQVDEDREMQSIGALQNMITRHVLSSKHSLDEGIGMAAQYITNAFRETDPESKHLIVTNQVFYTNWGGATIQLENIIAIIPGSQPDLGAVVIGAHYDSRSSDLNDGSAPAPGADDNASGIAALIELARILSPFQPRLTIILVAFSGEEIGRRGSIHFVRDYLEANQIPVSAMINLDVIGGSGQDGIAVDGDRIRLFSSKLDDTPERSLARTIQFIAYQYMPDISVDVQVRADRLGRYGDQQSFNDKHYPAVRFTEEPEDASREDNSLDTIDLIQPGYLRHSTQAVLAAVKVLADGPRPPLNLTLTTNPDGSFKLSWELVSEAASYVVALRSPGSLIYDHQFEVIGTTVDWAGFDPACQAGIAIAVKDADGLMGPLSSEYHFP